MPPESNQRFPKQARITHQRDFELVFRSGTVAADNVLVVHAVRSESGRSRLGISILRRVGNAVVRNRWKRLIREAFRRQQDELPKGLDLIIRPKRVQFPIMMRFDVLSYISARNSTGDCLTRNTDSRSITPD